MSEITEAARQRAEAAQQRRDNLIAALETERHGYVVRGLDDRVRQVDEQIAIAKKATPVVEEQQVDAAKIAEKTEAAHSVNESGNGEAEKSVEQKPAAKKPAAKKPAARKPAAKK